MENNNKNRPYQLLIVDDEATIRDGLSKIIKWGEIGFDTPYTAENGLRAIEILKGNPINAIITDIRMPQITGLELIRIAKELNPSIKVVIISGFDKFEYAFEAIKLQVEDFILKPINPDQVKEVFLSIKEKLDSELGFDDFSSNYKCRIIANQIIENFENGNLDSSNKLLKEYFSKIKSLPYLAQKNIANEIISLLATYFNVSIHNLNIQNKINEIADNDQCDTEISFFEKYHRLFEIIQSKTGKMTTVLCNRAKKMVEEQYSNPNLSIKKISTELSVSYGYLSSVFREKEGIGLKAYLIKTRMIKARELLLSRQLKVLEVAKAVGYFNYRYFSDAFSSYYGKSPSGYLKQVNKSCIKSTKND